MLVVPGQRIGQANNFKCGNGTIVIGDFIYATLLGQQVLENGTVSVKSRSQYKTPAVGAQVIGRVYKITTMEASVQILIVEGESTQFTGIIRKQDIAQQTRDVVQSFRLGDVVVARVLHLLQGKSCHLSTVDEDCGVILATSIEGNSMVPISWEEMMDTKTRKIEFRKCAKP
ncbi:hypothetical protein EDD86DRAFT_234566, partial [Gorgonomyces haynaldii]